MRNRFEQMIAQETKEKTSLCLKARAGEIDIPSKEPFKNDKLDRKKYADVLTSAVCAYQDGAVIALNGSWGTGKTTFVKMWKQQLENNGFPVVYYNAWEDDVSDEPLLSMLQGLKTVAKDDSNIDGVFRTGAKVLVGSLLGALIGATGRFGQIAKEAVKGGAKQLEDECYKALDAKDSNLEVLEAFRESLVDYVATVCNQGKPLVYLIDELDRCNPSFAVKVLERIKHLFEVPNVVFVLSIDKRQLAYSINGFYGSENINSMEYLRRFIDIDYNLPLSKSDLYCDYLFDLYGLGRCIPKAQDALDFKRAASFIVESKKLNLRQIDRIFSLLRIAYCSMRTVNFYDVTVFFFLSYLKVCEPGFYRQIEDYAFTIQQFVDELESFSMKANLEKTNDDFDTMYLGMMSSILCCYYESLRIKNAYHKERVGALFEDGKLVLKFKHFDEEAMKSGIEAYCRPGSHQMISFFTDKLDLLSDFNTD